MISSSTLTKWYLLWLTITWKFQEAVYWHFGPSSHLKVIFTINWTPSSSIYSTNKISGAVLSIGREGEGKGRAALYSGCHSHQNCILILDLRAPFKDKALKKVLVFEFVRPPVSRNLLFSQFSHLLLILVPPPSIE